MAATWAENRDKPRGAVRSTSEADEVGPPPPQPGTKAIFDIVVHPVTDGLHSRDTMDDMAELFPGEILQLV